MDGSWLRECEFVPSKAYIPRKLRFFWVSLGVKRMVYKGKKTCPVLQAINLPPAGCRQKGFSMLDVISAAVM